MTFKEKCQALKGSLKELLTADNTDQITKAVSEIDSMESLYEESEKEKQSLKDKMIDIVKNTSFSEKSPSSDKTLLEKKSVDEALKDGLAKIISNDKGGK